ncbi:MAG: glycoside hydrolase family 3 C-terminal domain-containing protein [Treponema sp.]|nr:glycoside hydrolase family 3 C-terminal domain-containing protein [Treponema sp.]
MILLKELTIAEKAALLEGYNSWWTNSVPRLNIPAIYLTDGPVGVRKRIDEKGEGAVGLGVAHQSTAFPTPSSIANGWNTDNAEKMGYAIGKEAVALDVQVVLGPALNLKRDPRCGRNFEYYSEDPLLSGKLAAAFTRGVQKTGIAACPKHFALNNCENYRNMSDSVVDERTARELYLKSFEICVKESRPRTMMCAYNLINGFYCSENKWLLTQVLRDEWGFDGLVMTDWGATRDRVAGVIAGLDLDMPGGIWENRKSIIEAAESGKLPIDILDTAVSRVLKLVADTKNNAIEKTVDTDALLDTHAQLAIDIAVDCAVLLENKGLLPLAKSKKVLVIGHLFEKMRYQGAGSSGMNPVRLTSPKAAFDKAGAAYEYAQGYNEAVNEPDAKMESHALQKATDYDTVLFFGGLTEMLESEGFDRENLAMPQNQLSLIDKLCAAGKEVIIVLFGGSPMELPFVAKAAAILNMGLPGQGGGEACQRLLYGEANPAGRLSETWMRSCADIPFGESYSKKKIEQYRENIFAGYRYFDEAPEKILYPFGYGLSYTRFLYGDMKLTHKDRNIAVTISVTNAGNVDGADVVQLYVGKNSNSAVFKAQKELKAFGKVYLAAGETKAVTLAFCEDDLAYYNTKEHIWVVENGDYDIFVGASSRDIRTVGQIMITGRKEAALPYSQAVLEAYKNIASCSINDKVFAETIGYPIPAEPQLRPYTIESPLNDYKNSRMGRIFLKLFMKAVSFNQKQNAKVPSKDNEAAIKQHRFYMAFVPHNSARSLTQGGGGIFQMNFARAIVDIANGRLFSAIKQLTKKDPPLLPGSK